ncbi:MAG: cellulase family glycosylhydrolase [Solirubrobacteraceae bacterium]
MPRFRTLTLILLTCALALPALGAATAAASQGQTTFFEAGSDLFQPNQQAKIFAQMQTLGVHALRVELSWASVAPGPTSASKPGFDATNPAAYNWSEYAPVLARAKALNWPVLLTVTSPVPRWATSNRRAPYITRPEPLEFQEFMTAVAREFGGEVSIYSIWNEPNHPAFLLPQWNSNGTPASPRIYRGLYQAGYKGLQAAGLAHPRVLFGETAPTGFDKSTGLHDVAPLLFLRTALCLNASYKPSGSCGELQMTGYAHHAYTKAVNPHSVDPVRDDVTIGTLSRLSAALDKAARAHAIPSHLPIYLTEFGVQSFPNKELGVPVSTQAEYDAIAEHIAWSNPRVAAFSQYLLEDDPLGGKPGSSVHGGTVGFQTGLEYSNGRPKPLYSGWPLPLTVSKAQHGRVSLWGLVRPATGATKVTILVEKHGSHRYGALKTVTTSSRGYWALSSGVQGVLWRVRWKSPQGRTYEGPPIKAS